MLVWIVGFALLGSAGAVAAAGAVLLLPDRLRLTLVPLLVSYATGALLAVALVGLLPEAMARIGVEPVMNAALAGLLLFFGLERFVLARHSRGDTDAGSYHGGAALILIGDGLHNFVDGVVIAAAFLASIPVGVTTALAVILHELPHEVGDFAILLESGFTRGRALFWNLVSGSTTLAGAVLAYAAFDAVAALVPYVLAVSAAGFLYIALADLVPSLDRGAGLAASARQLGLILLGMATVLLLHLEG